MKILKTLITLLMTSATILTISATEKNPQQTKKKILIIGHRGDHFGTRTQNTIAAFKKALSNPDVDGIEVDVQETSDGFYICEHDQNLRRRYGCAKKIRTMTLNEILSLRRPGENSCDIPQFEEVFALLPKGKIMIVDPKGFNDFPRFFKHLADLQKKYGIPDSQIRTAPAAGLAKTEIIKNLPYIITYCPYFSQKGQTQPQYTIKVAINGAKAAKFKCAGYSFGFFRQPGKAFSPSQTLKRDYVESLQKAGLIVGVWTINDVDEAIYCRNIGVDYILSDSPGRIAAAFNENKK